MPIDANIHHQFQQKACELTDFSNAIEFSNGQSELIPLNYAVDSGNKFLKCISLKNNDTINKTITTHFKLEKNQLFTKQNIGDSNYWNELKEKLKLEKGSKEEVIILSIIKKLEESEEYQGAEQTAEPIQEGQSQSQPLETPQEAEKRARTGGITNTKIIDALINTRLDRVDLPK